jgi:hypothetical protein
LSAVQQIRQEAAFPLGASPLQRVPGVNAASRGMSSHMLEQYRPLATATLSRDVTFYQGNLGHEHSTKLFMFRALLGCENNVTFSSRVYLDFLAETVSLSPWFVDECTRTGEANFSLTTTI